MKEKKTTKGTKAFRIIYITLLFMLIAAICAALALLNDYLSDYEKSRPYSAVEDITFLLKNGDFSKLCESYTFEPSVFDGGTTASDYLSRNYSDAAIGYSENERSSSEAPIYDVFAGSERIAVITLKKSGEVSKYGFLLYTEDNVECVKLGGESVTVTAPANIGVYLNGIMLTSSNSTVTAEKNYAADCFDGFAAIPAMVSYYADGFLSVPTVSARYSDGENAEVTSTDDGYRVDYGGSSRALSDYRSMIVNFSECYAKYIAGDITFMTLCEWFPKNGSAYLESEKYITDYPVHDGFTLSECNISEFRQYAPLAFSVRVELTNTVSAGTQTEYPLCFTEWFVCIDGEWWVTGIEKNLL